MSAAFPVTAYAAMNALGTTTRDVVAGLRAGRSGLGACPLELPFETPTGAVPEPLPALPASLSAWDSRTARLAIAGLAVGNAISAVVLGAWLVTATGFSGAGTAFVAIVVAGLAVLAAAQAATLRA